MTVSNTTVTTSSNGTGTNGSDGAFSFAIGNIKFSDNSDLDVYIRDVGESPPTEALKTITTHYFITDSAGNQVNPGTHIMFDTSAGHSRPLNDQKVVIKRKIELTQSTDYASGDAFPADSHEDALDKLTLLVQQMQEQLDRAWTYPETYSTLANVKMPEPANDGIIKYNADATALVLDTDLVNSTYKLYASNTSDTTAGFLNDKLSAGTGLVKSNTSGVENQSVTLSIDLKDEDNMASDSASHAASQQSIKAYVDAVTASLNAQDLDFAGDSGGAQNVDLDTQSLTVEGGTGIDTTGSAQKISIAIDSTVTTNSGTQTLTNKTLTSPKLNEDVAITATATEVNILDGVTASTSELNIMDGVTATTSELNILDGVTSTASELNILDGVTSTASELNILDGVTASTSELNIMDGVTASTSELNIMDGVTASTSELNIMDGVTASTSELNIMDGVTASTSELNIMDGVTSTATELNILDGVTASTSEINVLDGATAGTNVASKALVVDSNKKINELIQDYGEFKHQGSDPANATAANDVRLYAKDSKLYTKDNSGIVTELGAGGGVGSIDTLFTIQAKSADAAYTAIGNGYVWSGAGSSLTNATLALETTALDLIQSEKVFAYDSGGSGIRNWWYHEQEIQNGYGGKNMVLQLQYFTRNCADSNIFRFYARDAAKPVFTSDGSADAGTNQILGAASWDASLSTSSPDDRKAAEVGDRIVIIDTSNNIHYRYITAVSGAVVTPGALTITYSGADIAPANSTVMLIGVMTDELDYLPANNMSAAGNNEAKLYKKQMQFPEGCRLFQFGFHVESTDADVELYYDDIALSANQFLQTSSQGEVEYYSRNQFGGYASSYAPYLTGSYSRDTTKNVIEVLSDSTNGLKITALQRCKISCNTRFQFNTANSGHLGWTKNTAIASITTFTDKSVFVSPLGYVGSTLAQSVGVTCPVIDYVLEKGDYIRLLTDGDGFNTADENPRVDITATPLVSDCILLSSQDEIFTDWNDADDEMVIYAGSGTTNLMGSNRSVRYKWRRNGSNMEIIGNYYHGTAGTAGSGDYKIPLPGGYRIASHSITQSGGSSTTTEQGPYGTFYFQATTGYWRRADGMVYSQVSELDKLTFRFESGNDNNSTTEIAVRSNLWGSGSFHNMSATPVYFAFRATVPIQGWSSTFNPVLSMPLVNFDRVWNTYQARIGGDGSLTSQSANFISSVSGGSGTVTVNYVSGLFTETPSVTIAAKGRSANRGLHISASSATSFTVQTWQVTTGATTSEQIDFDCSVTTQGADWKEPPQPTAAVIKPAVCILKNKLAYNVDGGDVGSTGAWYVIPLNTIEGESWFCTFDDSNDRFTLEPGQYEIEGIQTFYKTNRTQVVIYDYSNSKFLALGNSNFWHEGDSVSGMNTVLATFTLTASTTLEFKYRTSYDPGSNFGLGLNLGEDSNIQSCYGQVKIRKLK